MSNPLNEFLNRQIANWGVLYVKLHNYHWYVKGDQFFTLHAKFEELYNEAHIYLDSLAERMLALGGIPTATMKGYLETASIVEATGCEDAHAMVSATVSDFSIMLDELKEGIKLAEQSEDQTTGDILLGIHKNLEKQVWMLKAFLGQTVREPTAVEGLINGSMASNEEEMIRLGKEMEHMKTNSELEEDGLVPDPRQ